MKLSIERTDPTDAAWYQIFLHVGNLKIEVSCSHYAYEDCLKEAELLVLEFAREKVVLVSNEIYDLHP